MITENAELVQTLNNRSRLCAVLITEPIRLLVVWIITIVCIIQRLKSLARAFAHAKVTYIHIYR